MSSRGWIAEDEQSIGQSQIFRPSPLEYVSRPVQAIRLLKPARCNIARQFALPEWTRGEEHVFRYSTASRVHLRIIE
jgi:hypothetical protein